MISFIGYVLFLENDSNVFFKRSNLLQLVITKVTLLLLEKITKVLAKTKRYKLYQPTLLNKKSF